MVEVADSKEFKTLLEYLHHNRGFDFSGYKRATLLRRVSKRMSDVKISDVGDYVDYLEVHPEEFTQLFNTILIKVTAFLRDPGAWEYLAEAVIPQIVARKSGDEPIRVWSAGCATGEEPYTLTMLLAEALGAEAFRQRVKIYATDVDETALNDARQATYPAKSLEPLPAEWHERYFTRHGERHTFRVDLRRSIIFGRHDLMQHAPISHIDLLVCRNVLIYFNAEAQERILSRFQFALQNDGILFLGKAEMLLTHPNLFRPVDLKHRIFAKVAVAKPRETLEAPSRVADEDSRKQAAEARLREVAFDTAPVAQVVIDQRDLLTLANQRARMVFGLTMKDIGRPFRDLELSYRPVELRSMIEEALAQRRTVSVASVERPMPPGQGEAQFFNIDVLPLFHTTIEALGVTVTFTDVTQQTKLRAELQRSNADLETAYEELQSSNEELETTNEELQSTVEELETTNEELQSSNEELETMNEELQSANEELQTLNDELRQRTDELNHANTFLDSVIGGLRAAVVVLDAQGLIEVWSRHAEDLWGLRADEVQKRRFTDLDIGVPMEPVRDVIQACMTDGVTRPDVVLDATNRRGKAIRCRISCTPRLAAGGQRMGAILLMEEA